MHSHDIVDLRFSKCRLYSLMCSCFLCFGESMVLHFAHTGEALPALLAALIPVPGIVQHP